MATATIEVARPPGEVFAYVTDPSKFVEWQHGVVSGHRSGAGPQRPGDRVFSTRRMGLIRSRTTAEITEVDPPQRWRLRGIDGPVRADVQVLVEPLDGGTRSKVTVELEMSGFGIGRLVVPLAVRPRVPGEMDANMQRLKQRLEAIPGPR
jgi:uncharacterized protein YndB with AHSA1/START domain